MRGFRSVVLIIAAGCTSGTDPNTVPSCDDSPSPPGVLIDLPADEATHSEDLEWWYWAGHLQDERNRWYGFQMVFFLSNVVDHWAQLGHHSIVDQADSSFHHLMTIGVGRPRQVAGGYDLALPRISARGDSQGGVLHGKIDDYRLDLELDNLKAPVFHHGDGYTEYSVGGYTFYYSHERLEASGTLTTPTEQLAVKGTAWFDHQWGDLSEVRALGWNWFAVQLDDNREIMVFQIHDGSNTVFADGTLTDEDCNTTRLQDGDFSITATGEWQSPHTGCTYPLGWEISVQTMSFTLTPVLLDQELHELLPPIPYWEGAATVSGDVSGRAYVELTGHCK